MTKILLSKIDYHLQNPRFKKPKETPREALVELSSPETIELARHIAKHGLNPSKKLLVLKVGNRYVTQEGNRRLAAMKLLTNHALIDSLQLSKAIKLELKRAPAVILESLKSIDCAVSNTEAEAAVWVRLEHTGKNNGVGTAQWNREEQKRFDAKYFEEPSIVLQAVDLMRRLFANDATIESLLETPPLTTLERLLGDPNVRDFLGLAVVDKRLYCTLPEVELQKALRKIIIDITNPEKKDRVTTRTLNLREDRQNYLDKFSKTEIPDQSEKVPPWRVNDGPNPTQPAKPATAEKPASTKTRPIPSTEDRKKLLGPSFILRITENRRVNDLYHNLRELDVDKYANAVSVISRVFVEMSINHYLRKNLNKTDAELKSNHYSLLTKMTDVATDAKNKNKITRDQHQAIKRELGNADSGFHPNSLNAFIHNPDLTPNATELKRGWNNIEPLIKAIWE